MRWPNGNLLIRSPGTQVTGLPSSFNSLMFSNTRDGERFAPYRGGQGGVTNSSPEGFAPHAWTPPTVAGGMTARGFPAVTMTANVLSGGPMQAAATATMTMDAPSMSLIVSMSAPWTGAYTPTAALRLTIGMEATFTATFTGASNLAMIVPLGSTTFSAAFTGSADMRGDLSMTAEFGGAEPLSPEGLARAVWEALAADYVTSGTMGEKLNAAGSGGLSPTQSAQLAAAAKALQLGQFLALK